MSSPSFVPMPSIPEAPEGPEAPVNTGVFHVNSDNAVLQTAINKIASGNYLVAPFNRLALLNAEGEEVVKVPAANPHEYVTQEYLESNVLIARAALASPNQTTYQVETNSSTSSNGRDLRLADAIAYLQDHRGYAPSFYDSTRIFSIERQGG